MRAQPSLQRTGGRLLSFILGSDLHVLDKHLTGSELDTAFEGLEHDLAAKVLFRGPLKVG
jgi:hypothetical protein